jgi:phospholipase C
MRIARSIVLAIAASLAACNASSVTPQTRIYAGIPAAAGTPYPIASEMARRIKHIVILVQDGRSFENLFAGWPGADAPTYGFSRQTKVLLHEISIDAPSPGTSRAQAIADFDVGKMDGFSPDAYAYVRHADIAPYRALARAYVLADRMYPNQLGAAFTGGLNLVAGTARLAAGEYLVDSPSALGGCSSPKGTTTNVIKNGMYVANGGPFPCFTQFRTMADTLDAANVTWKSYSGVASLDAWNAIANVPTAHLSSPESNFLTDIANDRLPAVSWVWPSTASEPASTARFVAAIQRSSAWKSTAIVIIWNDWGGWYDNIVPPQVDELGDGFRVPMIVVSPFAKRGYVSHTVYDSGSILKFIEQINNLPSLGSPAAGYTDAQSASIIDTLDLSS